MATISRDLSHKIYDSTGLDKQNFQCKIVNIFLPIVPSICFGCSKETSHRDDNVWFG